MLGLLYKAITLIPGLTNAFIAHSQKKIDADLEAFKGSDGQNTQRLTAYWTATNENNRLKAAQNGWWGAKAIILMVGLPMAAHMGAVALDTLIPPFGSWGIPRLPPPYDQYEKEIVLSFFLIAPAMPVANSFAAWLGRKR
jgi:hypothetical protein